MPKIVVTVQGFRVPGSKVRVQVQSKSLIDKPLGKPEKTDTVKFIGTRSQKDCARKSVTAYKQR